ncbi:MAG TPA: bifunctional UDP-sugar hydrolase/5'-nucleotidase [Elusimicrobiales bacterium]|nr:bifunctional UDP-sugar hydrolase/5'-nucleotidase [Elusimicrobiales bacterium]
MRTFLAAALTLLCFVRAEAVTVSVYHTSDVHGWYSSRPAKWDAANSTRSIGGFAALSALLKTEKNPYILVDSGDMFQGTPEGNYTKGMASVLLMNKLGYSAAEVGNHDYDYTESNLKILISSAAFPFLGANVYYKDSGKHADYLKPYVIVERAGERIAVLGIAGRHTATSTLPANVKHLSFNDEGAETAKWMAEIKKQRPDAVVILAHIGIGGPYGGQKVEVSTLTLNDAMTAYGTVTVARNAPDAAVVLGGHNHTGLLSGYPDQGSGVLLGESYWGLTDVTKADLNFDTATGKFTGASVKLIPLWTDVTGEDAEVTAMIKTFKEAADVEMDKPLGESAVDLGTSKAGLDSDIGNWFTDAMRRQSGTDAAFQNTAGIRAELRKGPVKMRDIYQVMPFENTLVKLTMTGDQIKKLMEDNIRGGRTRLQLSGLTVKVSGGKDGSPEVITLEKDGREIAPGDKLTVATNNYLTTGGTGGKAFNDAEKSEDTMKPIRDLLIKDISENPIKELPPSGRIIRAE